MDLFDGFGCGREMFEVDVQTESGPKRCDALDSVAAFGDHAGLVDDPFHNAAGFPLIEVREDAVAMGIIRVEKLQQHLIVGIGGVQRVSDLVELIGGCFTCHRRVEDVRQTPTEVIDPLQIRDRGEQVLELVLLIGRQFLRPFAKQPHLRAERLPLGLRQLFLVGSRLFFAGGPQFRRVS